MGVICESTSIYISIFLVTWSLSSKPSWSRMYWCLPLSITTYLSSPHSTMDRTFELKLRVKQINVPPGVELIDEYGLNLTLEHNIGHIKELIWVNSDNYSLKPLFLKITYKDTDLNDLDSLGSIMGTSEPPEDTERDWQLTIDYTLFNSPFIPNREPVLPQFDVLVKAQVGEEKVTYSERYNLNALVRTIESDFRDKYNEQGDFVTATIDSSGKEKILTEDTLREALQLDVVPLRPVKLHILRMVTIRLDAQLGNDEYHEYIGNIHHTCHSVKLQLAQMTGKDPLSIVLYDEHRVVSGELSVPDDRKLGDVLGEEFFRREIPTLKYVCDRPKPAQVEAFDYSEAGSGLNTSLEFYTIELNGATMDFSTSDMIVNERDGYVLVNPAAYARMANRFHVVAGDFAGNLESSAPSISTQGHITEPPITTSNGQEAAQILTGNDVAAARMPRTSTPTATPTTIEEVEANAEPVPEVIREDPRGSRPAEVPPIQQIVDIPPHVAQQINAPNEDGEARSLIEVLRGLVMANRRNFVHVGVEVFAVFLVMGFDFFTFILRTEVLISLVVAALFVLFFFKGNAASEWLHRHVLQNAPQNQADFALIRALSKVMTFCNGLTDRFYAFIIDNIVRVLPVLIRPRYQWLARVARGEVTGWQEAIEIVKETIGTSILFVATLLPTVQDGVDSYLLEARNSEAQTIKNAISTILSEPKTPDHNQLFERAVRLQSGEDVSELLAKDTFEEYEDIVQLLKVWVTVNQVHRVFYSEVDRFEKGSSETIFSGREESDTAADNGLDGSHEHAELHMEPNIESIVHTEGSSGLEMNEANAVVTQR